MNGRMTQVTQILKRAHFRSGAFELYTVTLVIVCRWQKKNSVPISGPFVHTFPFCALVISASVVNVPVLCT